MKKRALSLILVLCMLFCMVPTMAFAVGETHHTCDASCGHVDSDPHKTVSSAEWTPWNSTTTLPSSGNYYLTEDVTVSAPCTVSGTLNLCLNGHTITSHTDSNYTNWNQAFTVSDGATFNLTDCSTASRPGYIDANASSYQHLWKEGTSADAADIPCNLIGGMITGFMSRYGGAVLNAGTFTMYAGNISGNACGDCGGVYNTGNFTMNGSSTICGNLATSGSGGGVRNFSSDSSITMNGGHIIYNKANYNDGGGIYLYSGSTAELNGATIQYNIAGNAGGGGVYFGGASLELSGMCTITDNRKGDADNNVYLASGKTITVSSTGLDNGTRIGVTTQSKPNGDTTVAITGENSNDYSGCFISDDLTSYHIENGANNVVVLKAGATSATYTVTFDANGHGTAPTSQTVTSGETASEPAALTENGYTFGGWYTDIGCATAFDFSTPITGDITLYAKWTENTPVATPYNIWIGNVQVKSDNLEIDSSDNAAISGSAAYDPTTKTLTLTDFQYAGGHYHDGADETSAISVKEDGITIVFSGENMIEGTGDCGLYADVTGHIKLKAADENSTLTFICEDTRAFLHRPVLVGDIDIYAGSNDGDAELVTYDVFVEHPYYSYEYVKFVPGKAYPGKSIVVSANYPRADYKVKSYDFTTGTRDFKGASYIDEIKINKDNELVIVLKDNYKLAVDKAIKGEIILQNKETKAETAIPVEILVKNIVHETFGERKPSEAVYVPNGDNQVILMDEDGGYVYFEEEMLKGTVKMNKEEKTYLNLMYGVNLKTEDTIDAIEEALGEEYMEKAIIEYYTFESRAFKNEVDFSYEAYEDDPHFFYLYKDGVFSKIDAVYNDDEDVEAWQWTALAEGTVIVTDVEIVLADEFTKNPDTGANDVVGVAAALAVTSLVAAAAISIKK